VTCALIQDGGISTSHTSGSTSTPLRATPTPANRR
jgi:hypothetical protein